MSPTTASGAREGRKGGRRAWRRRRREPLINSRPDTEASREVEEAPELVRLKLISLVPRLLMSCYLCTRLEGEVVARSEVVARDVVARGEG